MLNLDEVPKHIQDLILELQGQVNEAWKAGEYAILALVKENKALRKRIVELEAELLISEAEELALEAELLALERPLD